MITGWRVVGFIGGGGYAIPRSPRSVPKRLAVVRVVTGRFEFSAPTGRPEEHDLIVLNADGTETLLTNFRGLSSRGSFSPDGSQVVYATVSLRHPHRSFLWLIDASGGDPRPVPRGDVHLSDPTFSPDGKQIAYFEGGGDHSNFLRVMNADGSGNRVLVKREFGLIYGLDWSPDGSRLVFAADGVRSKSYRVGIWVVDADGSGLTRVLPDGEHPYWSPDGTRIAYELFSSSGLQSLWIADRRGTHPQELTGTARSGPWNPLDR